jgi:hypothetical protein
MGLFVARKLEFDWMAFFGWLLQQRLDFGIVLGNKLLDIVFLALCAYGSGVYD